jgi:uncharacterized membrane protein (UPF0127 family)
MRKEIGLVYRGKKININDVYQVPKIKEGIGMMFHKRETCPAMLFEFRKPSKMKIHSFFVFFSFVGVWMDNKNKIIEIKYVRPWQMSVSPKKEFYKLLEIPVNRKYRRQIMLLVESQKDL